MSNDRALPPSIGALVQDSAVRFARVEALVDGPQRLTFAELGAKVREATAAAMASGIEPGDRAAMWAPNSVEWVIAALGLVSAGASLVPLNTRYKGEEAGWVVARSSARLVVVADGFLGADYSGMLASSGIEFPELATTVSIGGSAKAGIIGFDDWLAAGSTISADEVDKRIASIGPEDVSDVFFTSGTTGRPKGVVVSHHQTMRVFQTWADVVGLVEGDRYLVVNPFFHTFGYKAGIIACLLRGATIVPEPVFDVPAVLARIAAEKITVVPGPPTLYSSILDGPDRSGLDLSSLRLAVTGAASVPVRLIERMREELTFKTVLTAYGLTECTGTVSMCRQDDDAVTVATTCGRAIPDPEIVIFKADGSTAAAGEAGEVCVRGYNVMREYFDDPVATAETIDADGWLHTGDIGVLDERGYLQITDRLKDMYVVGGFNAYPAEIEQTLAGHDAISEVAVIGVPDERMGEVGKAYVVTRPGTSLDSAELISWARERLANYKVPRFVEVVDALPRNASGKVLKVQLRG
ncbi:MAG: acyl-CoA synthetase [Mycobacterium sp.]|nr:acyl-CoA synthetase [Mycobacterium sp.]